MDETEFLRTPKAKLGEMAIHTLLTRFTKPLVYDLYIPDEHNTRILMQILGDRLRGKEIAPEKINCLSYYDKHLDLEDFNSLEGKVGQGLKESFKIRGSEDIAYPQKEDNWNIFERILNDQYTFAREWVVGHGVLFRYRDGKRKEFSEKNDQFFNPVELREFDRVYELIKPYIGLTNASAKVD
jgi:hypothetical protein